MIKITQDTLQKSLLSELSEQSKNPGDLYIFVETSPLFLCTSIAFKIFNYQLRNYPRRVIWATADQSIFHLMELGELAFKECSTIKEVENMELNSAKPKALTSANISVETTDQSVKTLDFAYTQEKKSKSIISKNGEIIQVQSSELAKLSLKHLFNQGDYNPSSLIESEENESNIIKAGKSIQDLDSWIDRIEATKKALNSMKSDYTEDGTEIDYTHIGSVSKSGAVSKNSRKRPKVSMYMTTFFCGALVFILFMIFFPTNVYTLEVKNPEDSATINFSIPSSSYTKQMLELSSDITVPTSGDNQSGTERASGKVDLVNKSSKAINLTNGSFSLMFDGKKYIHLRNTTLPNIITVSPFNEKNPVSITVQSIDLGSDFDQPVNTVFEILNELGQKPCSSCIAIASTEIRAGDGKGNKIITESDQSLLRTSVEGVLAQQRVLKLQELRDEKNGIDDVVVNNDWYRNINSNFIFSSDIGQQAIEISLKAKVESEVYYLQKSYLDELLQRENRDVDKVIEINIIESEGKFGDTPSEIKLKISYKFTKKISLDKKNVEKMLKENVDFVKVKEDIQKNYQSIKSVEKQEIGVKIPGLSPSVNIKYIKNN